MTPEEQRIAIARACGWKDPQPYWMDGLAPLHDDSCARSSLPKYLTDLNACHEMEKSLTYDECNAYHSKLETIQALDTYEQGGETEYPAQDFWFHAEAPQRCEAFLQIKGLWKEAL